MVATSPHRPEGLNLSSPAGYHASVAEPLSFGAIAYSPNDVHAANTLKVNGQKVKMSNDELPWLFTLRACWGPMSVFVGPASALRTALLPHPTANAASSDNAKRRLHLHGRSRRALNHLVARPAVSTVPSQDRKLFRGVYPRIKSLPAAFQRRATHLTMVEENQRRRFASRRRRRARIVRCAECQPRQIRACIRRLIIVARVRRLKCWRQERGRAFRTPHAD